MDTVNPMGGLMQLFGVEVEVTLRLTVSQSCLGVGDFAFSFLLSENCIAFRLGAPSLTRGQVCYL
jgi:hypothetical protein